MLKSPVKAKEKVVLFLEISHVKIFLSPTYPLKSNVYENIFFVSKNTHTRTKLSLANLFVQMQVFFHQKKKKIGLFVFQQKKYWYSSFLSVKFILKIQIN